MDSLSRSLILFRRIIRENKSPQATDHPLSNTLCKAMAIVSLRSGSRGRLENHNSTGYHSTSSAREPYDPAEIIGREAGNYPMTCLVNRSMKLDVITEEGPV